MLKITGIKKRYGAFALDVEGIEIAGGSHFVLLGPTGSGKTLLMNIVAGLVAPDSGSILSRGSDITLIPPEQRGFGIVYQDSALFPHLDVVGNIGFGLRMKGMRGKEISARVEKIMDDLGIIGLRGRRIEGLSGGEKQRVAIARALIMKPGLILLDEPFSSLDYMTRQGMMEFIGRIRTEYGPTLFHITHDFEEAMALADSVAVIRDGKVVQQGAMYEILHSPRDEFVATFAGMRNVYRGSIEGSGSGTVFRTGSGIGIFVGRDVSGAGTAAMVRADDIVIARKPLESSATNCLPGIVTRIVSRRGVCDLGMDIGEPMHAFITARSLSEMGLKEGDQVYAVFKGSAVHLF